MFAKVKTAGLFGVDGYPVEIEAVVQNGLPGFELTGVMSVETREAHARVWNALRHSSLKIEPKKITVNFSPAFMRKEGTAYDLPIAVAVLCGYGVADYRTLADTAFFGEIGLDGRLKAIRGALPLACALKEHGCSRLLVPLENAAEAALVEDIEVLGCGSIDEVIGVLQGKARNGSEDVQGSCDAVGSLLGRTSDFPAKRSGDSTVDFADVRGQAYLKRAAEIAVSGMHNILFSGPAGTGKTMIARRMPTIMPELSREEDIEISKVYSICGLLPEGRPLLSERPFRSPHHGITEAAFAGGGLRVMPGEISLASGGILFLDELPLFRRDVLETLRQPMEDHFITVTRMHGSFVYPADFLLAASMNNCACGYYPDMRKCRCSRAQIQAYMGRLSKPLMERIDICAEANPLRLEEIVGQPKDMAERSEVIRKRVERAHAVQKERYRQEEYRFNSRLNITGIEKYCRLEKEELDCVQEIFRRKELSGRTYHKVLKVARTIADMDGAEQIRVRHLQEAVELRSVEDRLFGAGRPVMR